MRAFNRKSDFALSWSWTKTCYSSRANAGMEGLYNRIYDLIATRWLIWMQAEGMMSLTWPGFVCGRITNHMHTSISYTLKMGVEWTHFLKFEQHLHPPPQKKQKKTKQNKNKQKKNTWGLTLWPPGDLDTILKIEFSILFYWLVSSDLLMTMPSDECHRILLMISQHLCR